MEAVVERPFTGQRLARRALTFNALHDDVTLMLEITAEATRNLEIEAICGRPTGAVTNTLPSRCTGMRLT